MMMMMITIIIIIIINFYVFCDVAYVSWPTSRCKYVTLLIDKYKVN